MDPAASSGARQEVVVDVPEAAPAPPAQAAASAPPARAAAPSPAQAAAPAAPPARAAAPSPAAPPAPAPAAPPAQAAAPPAPPLGLAALAPPRAPASAAARRVLMRRLLSRAPVATGLLVLGLAAAAPPPAQGAPPTRPAQAAAPRPPAPAAAAPPPAQGATPAQAAAPPPAAPLAPAAARRVLMRRLLSRAPMATALFVLGLAAAALGLFAMTLLPDDYSSLGPCAATDREAAALREKSKLLLLDAATQVLVAAVALLAPTRVFILYAALVVGLLTAYNATDVLWTLVACHEHVEGALSFHYWLFFGAVFLFAVLLVKKLAAIDTEYE